QRSETRIARERVHDRCLERLRNGWFEVAERRDHTAGLQRSQLRERAELVWRSPRQQLVNDGAESVDVGRGGDLLAGDLLGRHIGLGAENGSVLWSPGQFGGP